jgi:hypothetical protein
MTTNAGSTVIAGILRTIYLAQMQRSSDDDKTWIGFNTVVAGIAEGSIGIVCACAPSLHHFFRRFFGDTVTTVGSRSTTAQYPSFVTRSAGSRSRPEPPAPRTPQMASNRWGDEEAEPVEAYEWQQKSQLSDSMSDSAARPAPVFSHHPSKFRTLEQRMGEPRSFLHGATDDDDDSVHYSERW